jgi:hypothetical protein
MVYVVSWHPGARAELGLQPRAKSCKGGKSLTSKLQWDAVDAADAVDATDAVGMCSPLVAVVGLHGVCGVFDVGTHGCAP